jgi:hypothetical protein
LRGALVGNRTDDLLPLTGAMNPIIERARRRGVPIHRWSVGGVLQLEEIEEMLPRQ